MQTLIITGAIVTLAGIALLGHSARLALGVRRSADLDPDTSRAALTRVLYWNMAGLGIASLGLMAVVVAVILR
jgi:hypothetical protein